MPACDKQICECAGDNEAMSVLSEPAVAHFGKAEHAFDAPDRMLDPGAYLGLGAVFRPLDLIHHATVAIAAIGEIFGLCCVLADHRPLAAIRLVAPHAGLVAVQQIRQHPAVGNIGRRRHHWWISLLRLSTPKCPFIPKYHWFPFFV